MPQTAPLSPAAPLEHGAPHGAEHGALRGAVGRGAGRGAPSAPCSPTKLGEHGERRPHPPRTALPPHGAEHGAPHGANWTPETVNARLEAAGRALLSLPDSGYSTRLRTSSLEIVRTTLESYGWQSARARPPMPGARAITEMDEALGWIARIPADRYVLRRIVGGRALVSPLTDRHLFPWRRLAAVLGADHKAVQRWHAQGVGIIVASLKG